MTAREQLRVAVLYPANLASPRATPTRARINIQAIGQKVALHVIAEAGDSGSPASTTCSGDRGGDSKGREFSRLGFFRYTRRALRQLEAIKPDVIHAITTVAALPAALYKRRHPSTRFIFEMHGLAYFEQQDLRIGKRLALGFLDYWGAKHADAIIAMSHTQRDLLQRIYRARPEKIHVLWGPVDLDLFSYKEPRPSPPFVVGYCGNDCFWQGLATIFEASRILEPHPEIHFLLMGFPKERYLGIGLPNVTFTGPISRAETPGYLSRCHVLLSPRIGHPATETQYPFKLSAYLAAGRPVVVTAVNDQPAVVRQADCGFIVPPGNARALAEAILDLYRMPESQRLFLGRNARLFAERHLSLGHLSDMLLQIYRNS
ncbi:glycosyltransferase involved in cell wall biosynthesis [Thermodesulfitimonas autotrophica]|uniref:Glycosyltransferase involved in cell wall biosynthesis n=1 Tax=Thermodesulfitimonas autotrophica TaxID=1894989 RepID=A0A3N5ATS5_9THEO|nr:glycosyltransferase family 4 protein [Thermodesulfitimonas autotrophica]RPF47030.1 glycosyltransferase involved in cell wall biosynthesis [Thermodesulfitimonas autotrophica]